MENEIELSINEMAKLIDVSSTMIRNWEKNGLFEARRGANNYRVFLFQDIEKLRKIKVYSIEWQLNADTIKRILQNDTNNFTPDFPDVPMKPDETRKNLGYSQKNLSRKWKKEREKRNLTLEKVSREIGISASYLSRIEKQSVNISLEVLKKLSEYYGEGIVLFDEGDEFGDNYFTKKEDRDVIEIGESGIYIESLIKRNKAFMRPTIYTVLPNLGQKQPHKHSGEEFIHVLEGTIVITLNGSKEHVLAEGDSINFPSQVLHQWHNNTNKICKMIWVHCSGPAL